MSTIAPSTLPAAASFFAFVPPPVAALPRLELKARPARVQKRALTQADYQRFLPMVRRIAMRLARRIPSHVSLDDLVSAGWVGLIESFSRTDASMPVEEFEAYSSHRVKGSMLDYLRGLDPSARQIRNASRRIARAVAKLAAQLGREPQDHEMAASLEMTLDEYKETLANVQKAGMSRVELVDVDQLDPADDTLLPDEEASRRMLAKAIENAITTLPERLQNVLTLYYQESCTLKEIGAIMGVSESRVSQLHTEAMQRIRGVVGS